MVSKNMEVTAMSRMSPTVLIFLILIGVGCSGARPLETVRDRGDFLYDRGDYAAAGEQYAEIFDRYPGDWRAAYRLGECELELDRPSEARRWLEVAHTNNLRDPDIVDALAEAMFRLGDEARLYAFLKKRAESQQTVRAYLRLGRYAGDLGDPDSAQTAFQTAIALDDGEHIEPYLAAADFAESLGDMDEAVRRLRQAYGIDPGNDRVEQRLKDLGEVPGPTLAMPPGP